MANEKIVDLDHLTRYDSKLKTQANILQRSTEYILNQWVYRGNIYLKCTVAGTTASTSLNLTGVSVGDTLTDGTVTWTVFDPFAGSGGGATISDWASSTSYSLDDLVIYSNTLYKCTTAHTSTFSFDDTKWQGISVDTGQVEIPDWGQSTVYALNQCVIYNGDLYRCTTAHTSATTFDSTKWERILGGTSTALYTGTTWNNTSTSIVTQDVSDYDFIYVNYSLSDDGLTSDYDITRVFTPSDIGLIDLGVEIDTNNYVKLTMEKTSSTGYDIDFSEFSTLGHYKINKIVGFIGGGGSGSASITWATQQEVEALF